MNLQRQRARGFSLIEVMVALVIIGIGMMGIAKIQALSYASNGTASARSLAAIEAASLASAMRANRSYWSAPPAALTITVAGATATAVGDNTLNGTYGCTFGGANAPCTPAQVASYDLANWVTALNGLLPNVTGTVSCSLPVATQPVGCTINIQWAERQVSLTQAQNTGALSNNAAMAPPTYTLYVEP